jgi:hypothetical protein
MLLTDAYWCKFFSEIIVVYHGAVCFLFHYRQPKIHTIEGKKSNKRGTRRNTRGYQKMHPQMKDHLYHTPEEDS